MKSARALAGVAGAERLERWHAENYGSASGTKRAPGQKNLTLHTPRVLNPDRDAAAEAWLAADDGSAHGAAYNLPDRGGWWWLGTVDDGAHVVVLTIGPDGRHSAERYSANDHEYSQAETWLTDAAEESADALTPAAFAALLNPATVAGPAPALAVLPDPIAEPEWLALPAVLPLPEPVSLPPLTWQPAPPPAFSLAWVAAAPVAESVPVEAIELPPMPAERRGFRAWVRDQFVPVISPWVGTGPQLERPRLVRLEVAA